MKKMNNGANVNKSTPAAMQRASQHNVVEVINICLNGDMTAIVVDHREDPLFHTPGDNVKLALKSLMFTCVDEQGSTWDVSFDDLGWWTERNAYVLKLRLKPEEITALRQKAEASGHWMDWDEFFYELNYQLGQITNVGMKWIAKTKRSLINSQVNGGDAESLKKAILAKVREVQTSRLDKDEKAWRTMKLRGFLKDKTFAKMVEGLKKAQAKHYGYRD